MGHLLTSRVVQPDPDKVAAIKKMPVPTDVAAVGRLCGTLNYLAKFLPCLKPVFCHQASHCSDLSKYSLVLGTRTRLCCYNHEEVDNTGHYIPEKDLVVQCDASKNGLGACLLQEGRPICHASCTMSTAEENYAQIEKEALAIVFVMERFHQFTYGRPTVVHSDHKLLEAIMKKTLCKAPLRFKRCFCIYRSMTLKSSINLVTRCWLPTPCRERLFPMVESSKQHSLLSTLCKESISGL